MIKKLLDMVSRSDGSTVTHVSVVDRNLQPRGHLAYMSGAFLKQKDQLSVYEVHGNTIAVRVYRDDHLYGAAELEGASNRYYSVGEKFTIVEISNE